jgi:YebC/PmpR family DNA-binding regulatory protein
VSGHSKWSTIKHKKGAADAKRGQLFSKLSRAIMVAAKEGGPDPASNLALQNAIEKARSYSMPKDNIERAIAKGAGEGGDGASFETVVYEGYGPEGVAVIVEALTDNRNRTASEVRHLFTKHGGNLGATGAVAWQFERRGVVLVSADDVDEDELVLAAAEAGADDVELDGSSFVVSATPEALTEVREALDAGGFPLESAGLSMVPKTTVAIGDESTAKQVMRLVEGLEENDDVQDVYANFDIPEAVLEVVATGGGGTPCSPHEPPPSALRTDRPCSASRAAKPPSGRDRLRTADLGGVGTRRCA